VKKKIKNLLLFLEKTLDKSGIQCYTIITKRGKTERSKTMIEMLMETYNLSREEVIEVLFAED